MTVGSFLLAKTSGEDIAPEPGTIGKQSIRPASMIDPVMSKGELSDTDLAKSFQQ